MREFTFTVRYDAGEDALMDVFRGTPTLTSRALSACDGPGAFWRLERFTGPREALSRVERLRTDGDGGESLDTRDGITESVHDVIERGDGQLVLYSYLSGLCGTTTVHGLVGRYLDRGTVVESEREGDGVSYRLLMRSDRNVGLVYDALTAGLREGLSFETGHLCDAESWHPGLSAETTLPGEQRRALREAFERGYYETPRRLSLEELAEALSVPRSTLSYRLRRAESRLVQGFFHEEPDDRR
jgi:hypothetical protein